MQSMGNSGLTLLMMTLASIKFHGPSSPGSAVMSIIRLAPSLFRGVSVLRKVMIITGQRPLHSLRPRRGNYFLSADIPRDRLGASLVNHLSIYQKNLFLRIFVPPFGNENFHENMAKTQTPLLGQETRIFAKMEKCSQQ